MHATRRGFGLLTGLVTALVVVDPVAAQAATGLQGASYFDATVCAAPPAGYEDFTSYPGLVMTGSLDGCWYMKVITAKETPSGVYLESGEEVFIGTLDDGTGGTFSTVYKFEAKYAPDVATGVELRGRCQHPLLGGSGTGGFAGATGRVDFKDIIGETVTYVYRGQIRIR